LGWGRGEGSASVSISVQAVLNWYSSQFKNNHFTEMCSGTEAGSYLRLIDPCITQLLRRKDLLGPATRVKKKRRRHLAGVVDRPARCDLHRHAPPPHLSHLDNRTLSRDPVPNHARSGMCLRILVYSVIYDSGWVSLEHLLLSRYPSQSPPLSTLRYHPFVSEWLLTGRFYCRGRRADRGDEDGGVASVLLEGHPDPRILTQLLAPCHC